jgi:hypothetical protein
LYDTNIGGSQQPAYRRIQCHGFEFTGKHANLGKPEAMYVFEDEQFALFATMESARGQTDKPKISFLRTPPAWTWLRRPIRARLRGWVLAKQKDASSKDKIFEDYSRHRRAEMMSSEPVRW